MAWKNGGGETIEIAVHPAGAGLDGFDWRISMARVESDGPFSAFPGVDRTLAILEGEGMELDIDGFGRHRLTPETAPFTFPADAATEASLLGGPITDLNVMARRGTAKHRVSRIDISSETSVRPCAEWTILIPLGPVASKAGEGSSAMLGPRDALLLERGDPSILLRTDMPQTAFLIEIDPCEEASGTP
nr:HutD family protein [Fulvimarina endophytica]